MKMRHRKKLFKPVYRLRPNVKISVIDESTARTEHDSVQYIFSDRGPNPPIVMSKVISKIITEDLMSGLSVIEKLIPTTTMTPEDIKSLNKL